MSAGIGPQSTPEHGPGCSYAGPTLDGPRCTAPATTHLMVQTAEYGTVAVQSCGDHLLYALTTGTVLDRHPFAAVCGLPGTVWTHSPDSRCVIDDSGVAPDHLTASKELAR